MMAGSGSAQLHALAGRLKAAGDGRLRLQLLRGLRAAGAPLVADVQAQARARLPKGGGLNEQVAGQKVTVSIRTGAATAGVRLFTRAPDTSQTDEGYVRHPTFGHRSEGEWRREETPDAAGWWTDTLAASAPLVTPGLLAVMETVAAEIQGGV